MAPNPSSTRCLQNFWPFRLVTPHLDNWVTMILPRFLLIHLREQMGYTFICGDILCFTNLVWHVFLLLESCAYPLTTKPERCFINYVGLIESLEHRRCTPKRVSSSKHLTIGLISRMRSRTSSSHRLWRSRPFPKARLMSVTPTVGQRFIHQTVSLTFSLLSLSDDPIVAGAYAA